MLYGLIADTKDGTSFSDSAKHLIFCDPDDPLLVTAPVDIGLAQGFLLFRTFRHIVAVIFFFAHCTDRDNKIARICIHSEDFVIYGLVHAAGPLPRKVFRIVDGCDSPVGHKYVCSAHIVSCAGGTVTVDHSVAVNRSCAPGPAFILCGHIQLSAVFTDNNYRIAVIIRCIDIQSHKFDKKLPCPGAVCTVHVGILYIITNCLIAEFRIQKIRRYPLLKFSQCIGFSFLYHGILVVHFRKTAADGCRYFISQKLFIQGSGGRCCICGIRFGCAFCLRLIISGLIVCCGSILTSCRCFGAFCHGAQIL